MDVSVGIFQDNSKNVPKMALTQGDDTIVVPWPVWETVVHQASHLYVSWVLAHPEEYKAFQKAVDDGLYRELREDGARVETY